MSGTDKGRSSPFHTCGGTEDEGAHLGRVKGEGLGKVGWYRLNHKVSQTLGVENTHHPHPLVHM